MDTKKKANRSDRFETPASATRWHLAKRLLRGKGYRPDSDTTADSLPQAFRLEAPAPAAGERAKPARS